MLPQNDDASTIGFSKDLLIEFVHMSETKNKLDCLPDVRRFQSCSKNLAIVKSPQQAAADMTPP